MKIDRHETLVIAAGFVVLGASVVIPMAQRIAEQRLVHRMQADAIDFQKRLAASSKSAVPLANTQPVTATESGLKVRVAAFVDTLAPKVALADAMGTERWNQPSTHPLSQRAVELRKARPVRVEKEAAEGKTRVSW